MPTISLPPHGGVATTPGQPRTQEPPRSLSVRAFVATHRRSLTRELSDGANPASSPGLTLRADQLTSERRRRSLARALRRTVHEALHPLPRRASFGLARRGAVIDAQDAIDILVKRLRSPEPIAAEGAALIERMLSDGAWSPLYNTAAPGALRRLVVMATAALEPSVSRR
jgi:hypothetical protein